ncbi:MAG: DUF3467 domain-containing protein [Bacteroidales bacterium]|nr:DUF3467 domain-containing protein [Bacteroidales bacterium]
MNANNNDGKLKIEMTKEVAKGVYSNLAIISHSQTEFLIDFAQLFPGIGKAEVVSRVIMAPEHLKRLAAALNENIRKYEQAHGEIQMGANKNNIPFGFGPNTPKA